MTLFIAMERLKSEFAPKKKQDFIHLKWQKMLDGQLATTILNAVRNEVGPLSPEQEKAVIGKLRGANTPSTGVQIDEFCWSLGVKGLEKDMTELRNKLTHTAAYGDFDLSRVLSFARRAFARRRRLCADDKQILTWEQMGAILARAKRRDQLILTLDMTDAIRPSELFALRWRSFDNVNTLSLTETVYRRQLRPFGKTTKSLGKMHLPDGLAAELNLWKRQCPDPSPEAFIFASADGGAIDTANYRSRTLKSLAEELGIPKLNFQVLRRTMATRAQTWDR